MILHIKMWGDLETVHEPPGSGGFAVSMTPSEYRVHARTGLCGITAKCVPSGSESGEDLRHSLVVDSYLAELLGSCEFAASGSWPVGETRNRASPNALLWTANLSHETPMPEKMSVWLFAAR